MSKLVLILKICVGLLLVGTVGLGIAAIVLDEPRPRGESGPEADALAKQVMAAVDVEAWSKVGAVKWTFADRRAHLWDRTRGLARVRFDDVEALIDLAQPRAHVTKAGAVIDGPAAEEARKQAYEAWVNDSFWLNPFPKPFDDGVTRAIVELDDAPALMITFSEGGVTPGDAYVFRLGEDHLPTQWRMWVGIIPTGGLVATWEDWITLPGGAKIATRHEGLATLKLTDIETATSAAALDDGTDPFAALLEKTAAPAPTGAASQPARAASRPAAETSAPREAPSPAEAPRAAPSGPAKPAAPAAAPAEEL